MHWNILGEFDLMNSFFIGNVEIEKTMDKIVALCKNRGFVYPGSEIYGGLANTWDYGPLGVELKTNIKNAWRKKFIQGIQSLCFYREPRSYPWFFQNYS